jgi:N-acetylmuramoyl-L-alanine amidase
MRLAIGAVLFLGALAAGLWCLRQALPPVPITYVERPAKLKQSTKYPPGFATRDIFIDAGHGGAQPGATSPWSPPEKTVNLRIAKRLGEHLRATGKYRVGFTRTTDTTVAIGARRRISNGRRPDAFLSIHSDWADENYKHGTWMIWSSRQDEAVQARSARLAAHLGAGLKTARLPLYNWGHELLPGARPNGAHHYLGVWTEYASYVTDARQLGVLDGNEAPAVLIETHFLSNPASVAFFQRRGTIDRFCVAIEAGLRGFFLEPQPG